MRPQDATTYRNYPMSISKPAPNYPSAALYANMEGSVVLGINIAPDGTVPTMRLICSYPKGYDFERSAIEAVRYWKYQKSETGYSDIRVMVRFLLR